MAIVLAFVFGLLSVCTAQTSRSICQSCSFKQEMPKVKLPEPMTLDNYNNHLASHTWSEIYFAVPVNNPRFSPPFTPIINTKLTFQSVSANLSLLSFVADTYTGINTGICERGSYTLELSNPSSGGAIFTAGGSTLYLFWSSCPTKYFWCLECDSWNSTHCGGSDSRVFLAVKDQGYFYTMKNMPLVSMMTDLRRETGIIFGNEYFTWFWTLGDSQFCT